MDEQYFNHIRFPGHLLRRLIHMAMAIIPVVYYWYLPQFALQVGIKPDTIVIVVLLFVVVLEALRLFSNKTIFGQRQYERVKISGAAYAFVSIGLVLIFIPHVGSHGAGFAIPLIWSLSFVDPLMGEARILGLHSFYVTCLGLVALFLIWMGSVIFLATPVWVLPVVIPLSIFAENYLGRWLDDNAGMLLLPLLSLICFYSNVR